MHPQPVTAPACPFIQQGLHAVPAEAAVSGKHSACFARSLSRDCMQCQQRLAVPGSKGAESHGSPCCNPQKHTHASGMHICVTDSAEARALPNSMPLLALLSPGKA